MDLPQPPSDQDLRNIIDKLAQFVARNGPEFEHMTKTKQRDNPKFSFLYGGEHYHYYTYKVNAEQAILRQRGPPPSPSAGPPQSGGAMYNRPPPSFNTPPWNRGGPGFRGPPPAGFGGPPTPRMPEMSPSGPSHSPHDNWSMSGGPPHSMSHHESPKLRPLMDIPTRAPLNEESATKPEADEENLEEKICEFEDKIGAQQKQIQQSEQNLEAQRKVTDTQIEDLTESTIRAARYEHLELLSHDTDISLSDIEDMVQPIIDSCTKETIGTGKVWIFQYATTHDRNRLLARYLAYKVTEPSASFQLKLHLIYLMNDVVHHCVRKNNEDLKGSLESVAVEMFCSAWLSSTINTDDPAHKQGKLTKLIKLWQNKTIFSQVTLSRMRDVDDTWKTCNEQARLDYEQAIKAATQNLKDTYKNYSDQHTAFVTHAENTIKSLEKEIEDLRQRIEDKKNQPPPPPPILHPPPPAMTTTPTTEGPRKGGRGSRWDTGSDGQTIQHHTADFKMPQVTEPPAPQSGLMLPDFSRPPPGFGGPPPSMMGNPNMGLQDNSLIPTLPYYDLPAGLMVPLIKLEDSGYKALHTRDLRLPPPSPPTDRLMAALEQFYALPSHDRPRDPEGWEMLGLYEWSKAKTAAIKQKADDIEDGRRDRSPTLSPEPYLNEDDEMRQEEVAEPATPATHSKPFQEKPRYRSRSRSPRTPRSRSRTRSRSRESTPEDNRGRTRRSPSPGGDYALPSYLTKRSPSPDRGNSSSRSHDRKSNNLRRSPTPPENSFHGFASAKQLDSSNKGHQMMQKMGWKGSGLGQSEDGIVEPISGGEVRDRKDQFKGVGHGADPFEAFRKSKAGSFYTRMKERDKDRDSSRKGSFKNN